MVYFKDGILKVKYRETHNTEKTLRNIYDILFVLSNCSIYLFSSYKMISPAFQVALFLISAILILARDKENIVVPKNFIWYFIFFSYCGLSALWSEYYFSTMTGALMRMVVICLMITSISNYIDTEKDLEHLISLFILSVTFIVLWEFSVTPVGSWTKGFLGSALSGNNSNDIAFWVACAGMFCFHKAYIKGEKPYYLLMVFFMIFTVFSSSRKALLIVILAPTIMLLLDTNKKNYFFRIILILMAIFFVFYAIMINDTLYNIIGKRFESSFYFLTGNEETDTSLYLRRYFISAAKQMFASSPVVGKGFGNFSRLFLEIISVESTNYQGTYAHNNYWQILSELGIIGFVLYYSMYVYMFAKLCKRIFVNKDRFVYVFLAFLILMTVFEVGIVSLNSKYCQFMLALTYAGTYATKSKQIILR